MSAIVPDFGCSNNQVQIPTEHNAKIEFDISLLNKPNVSNKDNRGISFKEAPYF